MRHRQIPTPALARDWPERAQPVLPGYLPENRRPGCNLPGGTGSVATPPPPEQGEDPRRRRPPDSEGREGKNATQESGAAPVQPEAMSEPGRNSENGEWHTSGVQFNIPSVMNRSGSRRGPGARLCRSGVGPGLPEWSTIHRRCAPCGPQVLPGRWQHRHGDR